MRTYPNTKIYFLTKSSSQTCQTIQIQKKGAIFETLGAAGMGLNLGVAYQKFVALCMIVIEKYTNKSEFEGLCGFDNPSPMESEILFKLQEPK